MEIPKQNGVGPLFEQSRTALGQFELEAVVGTGGVGLLELFDRGVREENDVQARGAQPVQADEKGRPPLGDGDPALAVTEVLNRGLVGLLADVLDEELFDPVSGIDDEETEGVASCF